MSREFDEDPDEEDMDGEEEEGGTEVCSRCGREVYEGSARCPYCGEYMTEGEVGRGWKTWVVIGLVLAVLAAVLMVMS